MTVSDWIGIYAGITATVAIVWNILRERRKIKVRVRHALGTGGLSGKEMVVIEVINNGRAPINIHEVGFVLSDGRRLINPESQHNLGWLKDRDGTSYYVPRDEVEAMVKEAKKHGLSIVAAYVRDSTSRYYKGKIGKHADWFGE